MSASTFLLTMLAATAQAAVAAPPVTPPPVAAPPLAVPPAAPPPAPAGGMLLRAGTPVLTRTLEPLSSRDVQQGQRFRLAVVKPVLVDGLVVIPAGATGYGEVRRVVEKGMMGKAGKLDIVPLYVEIGGARILLDGEAIGKGESNLGPVVIGVPVVAAFAFISGTHAILPAGTDLPARIHADLPLRRPD